MSEIIEIFDPISDKKRKVKNLHYKHYMMPNNKGEEVSEKVVQFKVIGINNEWDLYIPFRDFKKHNRDLINKIKG